MLLWRRVPIPRDRLNWFRPGIAADLPAEKATVCATICWRLPLI
jgi:hypothetical protein